MRAPRVKAQAVKVGDLILTYYKPRTWLRVTAVKYRRPICDWDCSVTLDTDRNRTLWKPDDLVPCQPQVTK